MTPTIATARQQVAAVLAGVSVFSLDHEPLREWPGAVLATVEFEGTNDERWAIKLAVRVYARMDNLGDAVFATSDAAVDEVDAALHLTDLEMSEWAVKMLAFPPTANRGPLTARVAERIVLVPRTDLL